MKLVVCNDDVERADIIIAGLTDICSKTGISVSSCTSKKLLKVMKEELFDYNIVILTMHYPLILKNGIEIGKLINEEYPHCQIIYCVSDYDAIPRIYEVEHCYLFREQDLEIWVDKAIDKAIAKCENNGDKHYMEFMYERKPVVLSQSAINYIEREQRVVSIHTDTKKYQIYSSIKEIVDQLDDNFVRCQGGFIVNLDKIIGISSSEIQMMSGEMIPVGKTYKEKFRAAYRDYIKKNQKA